MLNRRCLISRENGSKNVKSNSDCRENDLIKKNDTFTRTMTLLKSGLMILKMHNLSQHRLGSKY